ncbi:flagellar brake protein [Paenibacillus dakarensis]|uniref:flagellar brake protein n=1 Tax=Paenibacillus dakarensis TaxID=1527293 RepID=UPI000A91B05D|nr:flagellar brake domain-containing protein [Paenibacillus dakarensis]
MYLKVNEVLFIQVDTGDEKEAKLVYKSRISEITEDSIFMEVPIQEGTGRLKKLYLGDELSIYFLSEGGIKNYFNTHVLGFHDDVIRQVRIRKPEAEEITKIQRRSFLRVQAELEIAMSHKDGSKFLSKTEDVGGGGVSFYSAPDQTVNEEDILSCWLLIPYKNGMVEHVPFEAEVVRIKKLLNGRILTMLKFTSIADIERQKLIRYCFERQFDFKNR